MKQLRDAIDGLVALSKVPLLCGVEKRREEENCSRGCGKLELEMTVTF
jgi:hypothetical protein